jgi:hypothetical protein
VAGGWFPQGGFRYPLTMDADAHAARRLARSSSSGQPCSPLPTGSTRTRSKT